MTPLEEIPSAMAGDRQSRRPSRRLPKSAAAAADPGPAIILVRPQLAENIGMAARSMLNCGLGDLRLVNPRQGWPNEKAVAPAAGADLVLEAVKVFPTTAAAVSDLGRVYATTARDRRMTKEVLTLRAAARKMRAHITGGGRAGVLFGAEAKGLDNDDVALADALLMVPLNPTFRSLNLAQAVLLLSYEWLLSGDTTPDSVVATPKATRPANKEELVMMFEHLERELDDCGFLYPPEKRPVMVRNIRNIFQRAELTEQEVRTLRGIITGLSAKRKQNFPD